MRVISGTAKRVTLNVPNELVRPTTDKVRSAIFSRLQNIIEEAQVLDLFAGSGSLGIEALSRGSSQATFIEQDKKVAQCLKKNIARTKLEAQSKVFENSVEKSLRQLVLKKQSFDLIFADPPYYKSSADTNWSHLLLDSEDLAKIATPSSYFVLEEQSNTPQLAKLKYWKLLRTNTYGLCVVHIYQRLRA